jgi:glyoxylase-like metal-dependent hydrolase (beta-lactamase superfamily II)
MSQGAGLEDHRFAQDPRSVAARREYRIGDVTLVALSDGFILMDDDFIGSPAHPTAAHDALKDEHEELVMPIGCFLIQGETTVLIDLGYGPASSGGTIAGGNLLRQLRAEGLSPNDIDVVALSHLHPDHIGWLGNTHGEPVFPNAQVTFGRADWNYFVDSGEAALPLEPHIRQTLIVLAGRDRVTLLDGDEAITPEITRLAAPGHTPGHSIYAIADGNDRAVLFGDALYCAEQLTEFDWGAVTDVDRSLARATREKYVRAMETTGGLALGCHFPGLEAERMLVSRRE